MMTDKQIFAACFRFECSGSKLTKAWYVGDKAFKYVPDRPSNLTKWDIACALDCLDNMYMSWTKIYDALTKKQLLHFLYEKSDQYAFTTSQV